MPVALDRPILIYDGDCAFCSRAAEWIAARWSGDPTAVPWQRLGPSGLAEFGLSPADARRAAWWVDGRGRVFRGHAAIAKALGAGGRRDRIVGRLLLTPPVSWVARPGYWLVARFRYRLPGATDACRTTTTRAPPEE